MSGSMPLSATEKKERRPLSYFFIAKNICDERECAGRELRLIRFERRRRNNEEKIIAQLHGRIHFASFINFFLHLFINRIIFVVNDANGYVSFVEAVVFYAFFYSVQRFFSARADGTDITCKIKRRLRTYLLHAPKIIFIVEFSVLAI